MGVSVGDYVSLYEGAAEVLGAEAVAAYLRYPYAPII